MLIDDLPPELVRKVLHCLDGKAISTLLMALANKQQEARSVLNERLESFKLLVSRTIIDYLHDVDRFLTDLLLEEMHSADDTMHRLSSRLAVLDYFESAASLVNDGVYEFPIPIWVGYMCFNNQTVIGSTRLELQQEAQDDDDDAISIQLSTPFWKPCLLDTFHRDTNLPMELTGYNFQTVPPMGRMSVLLHAAGTMEKEENNDLKMLACSLDDNLVFARRRGGEELSLVLANGAQLQQRSSFLREAVDPYNILRGSNDSNSLYFLFRVQEQEEELQQREQHLEHTINALVSIMKRRREMQRLI